jgi:TolB-like protein/Flp pilus assembly protein TadD
MVKLYILGPPKLLTDDGRLEHSFLTGPKRLALLSYLLLARPKGFKRRDSLLPLFWTRKDQKSARNALSNILYHMRQALGKEVIINRGKEEIKLGDLWCDVEEFEENFKKARFEDASELYRGNLLEGLHVPDASPDFNQWLDQNRQRLRRKYTETLEKLAEKAEERGETDVAVRWWYKCNREADYDIRIMKRLMSSLTAENRKKEALEIGRTFAREMQRELGVEENQVFSELTKTLDEQAEKLKERRDLQSTEDLNSQTIAVIPFENLNPDGEITALATGIHNDLLTKLSKISSLNVIARTSLLRYLNQSVPISEIASELGVGTIVEGSVQKTAGRVRLNIQLTDARNERLLWAETYDREFKSDGFFEIQSELAEKIAETLRARYTVEEKERIEEKHTEDLAAYHLYAQGRTYLAQRTERGIRRALTYFKKSIEKDSEYALAWAGMAETVALINYYNYSVEEDLPEALTAIEKALEINPDLAEAHASLGIVHACKRRGPNAIKELKRAVSLQPSYAEAHNWLGWMYMMIGEMDKAIEPAERALELDPMAPYVRVYTGEIYMAAGRYEMALEQVKSARQMQPEFELNHLMEGLALYHLGRFSEAIFALEESLSLARSDGTPAMTEIQCVLGLTKSAAGNEAEFKEMYRSIRDNNDLFSSGMMQAVLGNTEKALDIFDDVAEWGYFTTAYLRYFFPNVLDPIRSNKRYSSLLDKVESDWNL